MAESKDDYDEVSLGYDMRTRLSAGAQIDDVFASCSQAELRLIQKGFASVFLKKSWLELTEAYVLRGEIASEFPRKEGVLPMVTTAVTEDLRSYMPGMREMPFKYYPTEGHAALEFARELNDLRWWNYPYSGSWLAPLKFEVEFHNAPDRNAFLAGCIRALSALIPILNIPDEDNLLFVEDNPGLPEPEREKHRRHGLRRARINAKRMMKWLLSRQQPIEQQLLDELEYIWLVPAWTEKGQLTDRLTVASGFQHPEDDIFLRFQMLLTRFQDAIPTTPAKLNILRGRLTRILSFPSVGLTQANFEQKAFKIRELTRQLPYFNFVDGTSDFTKDKTIGVADDFCFQLTYAITSRLFWAEKALSLVMEAIGEEKLVDERHLTRGQAIKARRSTQANRSLVINGYLTPNTNRVQLDGFLQRRGMLRQVDGRLEADENYKAGMWAAVRRALSDYGILKYMSHKLAAGVFAHTYKAQVTAGTMNFIPGPRTKMLGRVEATKFYYDLMDLLKEELPK